jgi:formate hydrogenlyase transcriptional activator
VLQEREFERLGGTQTVRVDARIIAATNRDLERLVEEGLFRSDLYYRLKVFPIHIPPLRERPEDIPFLVRHFTDRFARRMRRPITTIRASTMDALCRWNWPGNIRELEHVIERAVILSTGPDLQVQLRDLQAAAVPPRPGKGGTLKDINRATILEAPRAADGVVDGPDGAASRLGLKRTTLQSMMRKLGIQRPAY